MLCGWFQDFIASSAVQEEHSKLSVKERFKTQLQEYLDEPVVPRSVNTYEWGLSIVIVVKTLHVLRKSILVFQRRLWPANAYFQLQAT
jgi:hypothetical protein